MVEFKPLEGDKAVLKPFEKELASKFVEWINDPEVHFYLGPLIPFSLGEEHRFIEETWEQMRKREVFRFVIHEKKSFKLVGVVGLENVDWIHRNCELGIFIGEKDFWDKRYGTNPVKTVVKYSFKVLGLHEVWLRVLSFNKRAIKCYLKSGFTVEGESKEAAFVDGKWADDMIMGILNREEELRENHSDG